MDPTEKQNLNTNQAETVTFLEDGDVNSFNLVEVPVAPDFKKDAEDFLPHSVRGFLQRPLEMQNFDWTLASGWGTQLGQSVDLPADWLKVKMIREKLSGFLYLRCNFKVRVQVNAQPFHAGRLLIVYIPAKTQQSVNPTNEQHFGGLTGYRCVNLDLSDATSAEIKIPFGANISHLDLVKAIGLLGTVKIFVYSQLTGSSDVQGTVWLSAEDVEVQMATGLEPAVRAQVHMASEDPFRNFPGPKENETDKEFRQRVVEFSGIKEKIDTEAIQEKEKKRPGIIERVSGSIGNIGSALGWVPVVGTFAAGIGFAAKAVSGIAGLFGWSKPNDIRTTTPFQPVFQRNFANYDGDSKSKVLALDSENKVCFPSDVFQTDEDEMGIYSIIRNPVFTDRFNMKTEQVPNQVIWKWPVSPASCGKGKMIIGDFERSIKLNTYLSYLSEMFGAWRGAINYHFKIVKTRFHTGRIRVSFIPSMYEDTPLENLDVNKIYSKVYDIREITSFDFTVPFVFHQPWNSLVLMDELELKLSETFPTGLVIVEVLNSLRAPSTVANSIEFLVETSGGTDFQFAYPAVDDNYVVVPSTDVISLKHSSHTSDPESTPRLEKLKSRPYSTDKSFKSSLGIFKSGSVSTGEKTTDEYIPPKLPVQPEVVSSTGPPTRKIEIQDKPKPVEKPGYIVTDKHRALHFVAHPVVPDLNDLEPTAKYEVNAWTRMWADYVDQHPSQDNMDVFRKFVKAYPLEDRPEDTPPWEWPVRYIDGRFPRALNYLKILSGREAVGVLHMFDEVAPGPKVNIPDTNYMGMGEIVTSLRQILKRYTFMGLIPGTLETQAHVYYPYITAAAQSAIPGNRDKATNFNSMFDRVSFLYRWMAGSLRVAMVSVDSKGFTNSLSPGWMVKQLPAAGRYVDSVDLPPRSALQSSGPVVMSFPDTEKVVEVSVPFYQKNPAILTGVGSPHPSDVDGIFEYVPDRVPHNYGTVLVTNGKPTIEIFQSIGEDFSFGYLIGPPITVSTLNENKE